MISGGIFGPKLSGKTTLAIKLSQQYWISQQRKSLVLDPHNEPWGNQAMVFQDEDKFWGAVWGSTNSLIIVEEAAATIRRERELVPVFTRLRHNHHLLLIVGHSGMDLLPVMRQQLDTIYLFRQPISAAKVWAETFTNDALLQSVSLQQYEFIHATLYGQAQRMKLKL